MASLTPLTPRVKEILSWYRSENPGVLSKLQILLNTGNLAGTGKLVILPVDQGCEHGPSRSFAPNPDAYDPLYHFDLAIVGGCNAYAAPLGFLEAGAAEYAGRIPLILKLNNSDTIYNSKNPCPAVTASVKDALRLGCVGIGFTIYAGSSFRNLMYEEIREITAEAKAAGLCVVTWCYPRGEGLSKEGETAIDVVAYGAHMAAELGANIVKVKAPSAHLELEPVKKAFEKYKIPIATLADRARHVVKSTFNGRRIVIFSGGEARNDAEIFEEVSQLAAGGAFGSIMGRNSFQRPKAEGVAILNKVQAIYRDAK